MEDCNFKQADAELGQGQLHICYFIFLGGSLPVRLFSVFLSYIFARSSAYVVLSSLFFLWSSCEAVFLWGGLPVRWSSCEVVFLWGLPVRWSFCEMVILWGGFPVRWFSCEMVFLWGGLSVRLSSFKVVFLWCCPLVRSYSCEIFFLWGHIHFMKSSYEVVILKVCLPLRLRGNLLISLSSCEVRFHQKRTLLWFARYKQLFLLLCDFFIYVAAISSVIWVVWVAWMVGNWNWECVWQKKLLFSMYIYMVE